MTMWMLHSFDGRLLFASEHRERGISTITFTNAEPLTELMRAKETI